MANEVLLQEGHPLDSNLRPLKIGAINCNTIISNGIKSPLIVSTDLTINDSGDITLDAAGGDIDFNNDGSQMARISGSVSSTSLILNEK